MSTYFAKPGSVKPKWLEIDADGKVLGRLSSEIAKLLRGKHRPEFTPHVITGDFVIVTNAEKVKLTGKKWLKKKYWWHSGYPGGIKSRTAGEMRATHPERVITRAVWGMLPKNTLGRKLLLNLKVYAGATHPHGAQNPQKLNLEV